MSSLQEKLEKETAPSAPHSPSKKHRWLKNQCTASSKS